MKLAIVSCVLAACERAPAPAKTIVTSHAPASTRVAVPAAHYAALFAQGASWHYAVTTTGEIYMPDDPGADHDGMVRDTSTGDARCRVAEVRTWPGGVMSRVECEPSLGQDDPLAGAWAADADGLYKLDDLPAGGAAPELTDEGLVIAASPAPGKRGDDASATLGRSIAVSPRPGGWCVTRAAWAGDESYSTLCFAKAGVTSGASGWSGGSSHDTMFEQIR